MKNTNIRVLLNTLSGLISSNPREIQRNEIYQLTVKGWPGAKFPEVFKPLPNTESFSVSVNQLDPLLSKFGLSRKFSPELKFDNLNHRIKAANRYLRIQQTILFKFATSNQSLKFWHRAFMLLERSFVLRLVALRKLKPNFARDWKFGMVKLVLTSLETKISTLDTKMVVKRFYVDKIKPDGTKTFRPIGNPSYPDRMLMYLLSAFFVLYTYSYIGPYQHAYRPGKGVLTAWNDLKDFRMWEWIYELDLSQFFPSINVSYCMDAMQKALGLPKVVSDYIFDISLNYPDPATLNVHQGEKIEFDETNAQFKAELDAIGLLHNNPGVFKMRYTDAAGNYTGVVLKPIYGFIEANGRDLLIELMSEDLGYSKAEIEQYWFETLYEYWQVQSALFESFKPTAVPQKASASVMPGAGTEGLPLGKEPSFKLVPEPQIEGFVQGGALSPILSIFAFEHTLMRGNYIPRFRARFSTADEFSTLFKIVAYADDFIILVKRMFKEAFFLGEESTHILEPMGIRINKEKSGWIRQDGKFTVDKFKFLGITHHTATNLWEGTPRSGKDLMFDKGLAVDSFIAREMELRRIIKHFNFDLSPQALLDNWGRNEAPYSLIPEHVIADGTPMTDSEILALTRFLNPINTDSQITYGPLGSDSGFVMSDQEFKVTAPKPQESSHNAGSLKFGRGKGGFRTFLSSPKLQGYLLNRLHSGSWVTLPQLVEAKLAVMGTDWYKDPTDGKGTALPRSLAQLLVNSGLKSSKLHQFNISSYGIQALLFNKSHTALKIKGNKIRAKSKLF